MVHPCVGFRGRRTSNGIDKRFRTGNAAEQPARRHGDRSGSPYGWLGRDTASAVFGADGVFSRPNRNGSYASQVTSVADIHSVGCVAPGPLTGTIASVACEPGIVRAYGLSGFSVVVVGATRAESLPAAEDSAAACAITTATSRERTITAAPARRHGNRFTKENSLQGFTRWGYLPLAVILATAGTRCGASLQRYQYTELEMGVQARIVLYAPSEAVASEAAKVAFARIAELEDVMSDYRPSSELMRLCASAGGPPVHVSPDLLHVLRAARDRSIYDPRTGVLSPALAHTEGLWVTYESPDAARDWALILRRR